MIETLRDWNDRLSRCNCCNMPGATEPVVVSQKFLKIRTSLTGGIGFENDSIAQTRTESRSGTQTHPSPSFPGANGFDTNSYTWVRNRSASSYHSVLKFSPFFEECFGKRQGDTISSCSGSGSYHYYRSWETGSSSIVRSSTSIGAPVTNADNNNFGCLFQVSSTTTSVNSGGTDTDTDSWTQASPILSGLGTLEVELSNFVPYQTWLQSARESAKSLSNSSSVDDCWVEGDTGLPSLTFANGNKFDFTETFAKLRFRISNLHKGSKFYITYDIAEFPSDPNEENFIVSQDHTVEWTGPGTGDYDNESWLTPQIEIGQPSTEGYRSIANIRYSSYSGEKYGTKPQVGGIFVELPEE